MEPTPRYPLTPTTLGDGANVRVGNLVQATLFDHISTVAGSEHNLATSVELEPHALTGTWRVRWPLAFGAIIGEIDAATRADYPLVDVIHECGFIPAAQASFELDRITGIYDVIVHLALPEFVVPRNNPVDGAMVLPSGSGGVHERLPVDVTAGDYTEAETKRLSPGQWLVGLNIHENTVVVTCDGRVLGALGERDSVEVRALLEMLIDDPAPVLARAMAKDGTVTLDIARQSTVQAMRNLPTLPVSEMPQPNSFQVFEFGDGTVAVTVDSSVAVDPDDQPIPAGNARTVILPDTISEPPTKPIDETPTEPFPAPIGFTPPSHDSVASENNYLSEVEKVRVRRAQRDELLRKRVEQMLSAQSEPESEPEPVITPEEETSTYTGRHRKPD